jgi:phage tail tape-measure protein
MTSNAALRRNLGKVALALDEKISDAEMDALLAERRQEIQALLEEARLDEERGNEAPLEPLHLFLRRARERLQSRG